MPSLISSDEEQNKIQKRKRGRPAKVLTSEEFLALQNKPKRGRGRPKKELTEEEKRMKVLSTERGKGRPKKKTTPQEDWLLHHAPKKRKGRPKKDDILLEALPRIFAGSEQNIVRQALDLQEVCPPEQEEVVVEEKQEAVSPDLSHEISAVIEKIKTREETKQTSREMPKMPWTEFKQKMKITDCFVEEYVFPFSEKELHQEVSQVENIVKEEIKERPRLKVFSYDEPSSYILDLRKTSHQKGITTESARTDKEYAWEKKPVIAGSDKEKQKADFLRFDSPDYDIDNEIVYTKPKKEKAKTAKINLVKQDKKPEQSLILTKKEKKADNLLVSLGKFLCKVWDVFVYPFKALNFLLDAFLVAIISIFSFFTRNFWKLIKTNAFFLANIFSKKEMVAVTSQSEEIQVDKKIKPAYVFSLVCLLIVLPVVGVSFVNKVSKARGDVLGVSTDGIRYLTEAGDAFSDKNASQTLKYFSGARESFKEAESQIDSLGVVAGFFGQIVPEVKDGKKLIEAGSLVSEIGAELARGMALFGDDEDFESGECASLPGAETECFSMQNMDLTDKLSYIKNIFENQSSNIGLLIENIDSVDIDSLPTEYQAQVIVFKENVQNLNYIVSKLSDFFDFGLEFLGHDQAKRYLVIFQNTSEARATGGFMGSFALVDIYQGNVRQMEIPGGGFYDLKSANQVAVEAPKPLQVSSPIWQIWNANWFADFPASAEKIIWFYENLADSSSVDGVITLTEDVVVDMLGYTGEIKMDDYDKVFDQNNFIEELQKSVEIEYDAAENKPKKIIADMTPLLLDSIFDLEQKDFLNFLTSFSKSIEQEKVLFYFKEDSMQNLVRDMGWSGEIQGIEPNQDYLSVVHTNISGGKTDNVVKNKIRHSVYPQKDGSLLATVELTRSHLGSEDLIFENENNVDYVRFYVPAGSDFVSSEGFNFKPGYLFEHNLNETNITPDSQLLAIEKDIKIDEASNTRISSEFGKTAFGNWIQVAPGQERTVSITYRLPFSFKINTEKTGLKKWLSFFKQDKTGEKYVLIVDKQLGRGAEDFVSTLHLTADQTVLENITSGGKLEKNNQEINFISSLEKDGFYGLVFE
jgi:hypothetical protein